MDYARLVGDTWSAIARGDLDAMQAALAPDARWRAVQDGPWNCASRTQILEVMQGNLARGLAGEIEEVLDAGDRAVVAFRPAAALGGGVAAGRRDPLHGLDRSLRRPDHRDEGLRRPRGGPGVCGHRLAPPARALLFGVVALYYKK